VRVLPLSQFLETPAWTVYAELPPNRLEAGQLMVKTTGPGDMGVPNDWFEMGFATPGWDDTAELWAMMDAMRADPSVSRPLDPEEQTIRNGCYYEEGQMSFLVYELDDIRQIVNVLARALPHQLPVLDVINGADQAPTVTPPR
jgi:hypothetical protein